MYKKFINNVRHMFSFAQLKLRPTGRLNVQVRHFREGEGKT